MAGTAAFMACGGDDSGSTGGSGGTGGTGGNPDTNGKTATLVVLPSPSYSGFDGTHTYQIPLKLSTTVAGATWKADKPELVDIATTAEGITVTTKGAGDVVLTATAGSEFGQSHLKITQFTPDDWSTGDKRYNAPVSVFGDAGPPTGAPPPGGGGGGGGGMPGQLDLDKNGACTSCHGDTAVILSVQHTPYQTGGYSDDEMVTIFTMGKKPANAVQRSFIPAFYWGMFHAWNVTDPEKKGLTSYLRALTPKSQGDFDYPTRPTGGPGGGGDGGRPPTGGGTTGDAGSTPATGGDASTTTTPDSSLPATAADAGTEADAG